ncbi:MFS general substrate transporter [Cubamyces menziesii]|nr:MFS general substrate transporter [Cubamyces menziesii]
MWMHTVLPILPGSQVGILQAKMSTAALSSSTPSNEKGKVEDTIQVFDAESSETSKADLALRLTPSLTAEEERSLWRKVDMRLVPIAAALYLVSYLDRGNIGNAKLQGLLTQLSLTSNRYSITLTMFYLAYCIFTSPANLLLKRCGPSKWIPGLALAWGIVATLMGLAKTYPQFVGLRLCLGVAEAGLSPGVYYLLTLWYPRHMLQWRFGLFWGGATFSGAFSGLLAYGISFMSGAGGLLGWSWIFIIEGLISIVVAIIAFIVFVDLPETANFLSPRERAFLLRRLGDDNAAGEEAHFELRHVTEAILDWKVIMGCVINVAVTSGLYSGALFLPSIINGFGFNAAISQLLSVPPYVVATATVIICSLYSDRIRMRSPFVFLGLALAFIGFAINISNASIGAKYFGTYFVVTGAYLGAPMVIAWLGNNIVGHYKRGIAIGLQVMFGNIAAIIICNVYRVQDAPRYIPGHTAELAMLAVGLLLVPITVLIYSHRNGQRSKFLGDPDREPGAVPGRRGEYTEQELKRMGDRAPTFLYTL